MCYGAFEILQFYWDKKISNTKYAKSVEKYFKECDKITGANPGKKWIYKIFFYLLLAKILRFSFLFLLFFIL
jgi:hypothetical protein